MNTIGTVALGVFLISFGIWLFANTKKAQKQLVDNRKALGGKLSVLIAKNPFIYILYKLFSLIVAGAGVIFVLSAVEKNWK